MLLVLALFAGAAAAPAPRFAAGPTHLTVDGAPLVIRGINLGAARPGERPTDHAVDRATFARWFARMSELGINTVRVFDLQSPAFYQALAAHNRGRAPLYLLQGVWLDGQRGDLWDAGAELDRRSAEVIDAIHGGADIASRRFRASGRYRADVSPWTLGLVIGREIEPAEIAATNAAHPGRTSMRGAFLDVAAATPAEVWIASRLDAAIAHEARRYHTSRPVAAVSWPQLDPLRHPGAEPAMDRVSIDVTRIDRSRAPSGLFAAYSIYPYYPRFIWRDPAHRARDEDGANPYLGYLRRLVAHYRGLPLVVAEYGVPSSPAVVARDPVAHMSYGGNDEADQARINARLRRSIESAGCAGGVVFAWLDEWWKPTWILRRRSDPSRYPLWHDAISPEQNFGMIAFESESPPRARTAFAAGPVAAIELAANAGFFEVEVALARPHQRVEIGFDLGAGGGLPALPGGAATEPVQLALVIDGDSAELRVAAASDLSGLPGGAGWRPWRWKTPAVETPGHLGPGAVTIDGARIRVRLSWSLLHVGDPSRHQLSLAGPAGEITAVTCPGITAVVAAGDSAAVRSRRYLWPPWNRAPAVREREKPASRVFLDEPALAAAVR